jgi:Na+-transporting methylmalonyl-CoA/oxaloacetate decarboxylase gamma subunit
MVLLVVSIAAVVIALIAAVYAWRVAQNDRERSDARVAALAAAIDGSSNDGSPAPMFERAPPAGLQGRPLLKLGAGFVMAVLVIVLIAMSSGRHKGSVVEAQAATGTAAGRSLELLSMRHAQTGKNLTVTGLVRNPGAAVNAPIEAVVFVFARDGGFVASGRAPIEFGTIANGDESPFQVTIPDIKDVGRYRVSFRTTTGIVPHVDRRASLQVSN